MVCFFFKNSSLRLAFLLSVEGLFFLVSVSLCTLPLVSREKEKEEPMATEMLKTWSWLASAWQNSKHLESRAESSLFTPAIFASLLK